MFAERLDQTRWLLPAMFSALVATAALVASRATVPSASGRIAIRVTCDDAAACATAEAHAIDVWTERRTAGMPLDVVVTREGLAGLDAAHVRYEVLVPDIDAVARAEHARLHDSTIARPADWFAEYRDYRAITAHINELAEVAPDRASVHPLGSTLEGRTIWALRIGNGSEKMLINGTQHAREWIAAMVTTCVADRLVRDYERTPAIKAFVDSTELWVVPVVNPDGYQYSWSTDRYWRKNRRGGYGVDLNRNYAVAWGGSGSSSSKRSQVYRGEYAFSENESTALRDLSKRQQFALHLDFHSYGQLLMYPWMYTSTPAKDRDRYAAIGDRMASAMFAPHETRYRLLSGVETSPTAGTMTDWMYGEGNTLSFTIELRPRGGSGFVLPPKEIKPTCDEGLAAVLAMRAVSASSAR
jgi:hypothetical protein